MKHPTKIAAALVILAGASLAWVAYRSEDPTYSAPPRSSMPERVPRALAEAPASGELVRTFAVEGMCCAGCTGKLYQRLVEVDGVLEAAVDFETGRAQARVAAQVDPEELLSAMRFEKYEAQLVADGDLAQ